MKFFLASFAGFLSVFCGKRAFPAFELDKPRPSEHNFKRRIKSETASGAIGESPPPAFPEIFRGILCLPQWFPLRRPWAALLSLMTMPSLRLAYRPVVGLSSIGQPGVAVPT